MAADRALQDEIECVVEAVLEAKLRSPSGLLDDGVLDSLSTMKLVAALEERFRIVIQTRDFTHYNFNSIPAIAALVDCCTGARD